MTKVVTYRLLLREAKDGTDYSLERTYRSLVPPTVEGGPYSSQQGDTFFVDEVSEDGELLRGWHCGGSGGRRRADRPGGRARIVGGRDVKHGPVPSFPGFSRASRLSESYARSNA